VEQPFNDIVYRIIGSNRAIALDVRELIRWHVFDKALVRDLSP
jgi:hypothetical protein